MTPERWSLLERIFASALECDPLARPSFLRERCQGDPELQREVLSLLNWHEAATQSMRTKVMAFAAAAPDPELDEFVGTDRFLIRRRLGHGTFGVVYEAYDREEDTTVAIKRVRRPAGSGLSQLKNEFRSLAGILHPNLVRFFELFSSEVHWFFTMELVDGVQFHQAAARSTAGPDYVRRIFAQLASGVDALHSAGKLHRDLKPSNVLVTPEHRVVILDLGLAIETAGEDSAARRFAGTPVYMSPEQHAGDPLTPAADWYSAGLMLFQVLTGRLPFAGSPTEWASIKSRGDVPRPSTVTTGIPEDLDQLCGDLLRLDPVRRPIGAEVLSRLGSQPDRVLVSGSAPFVWIGREHHLAQLHRAFERARSGQVVVASLEGAAGSGKSALMRRFLQELKSGSESVVLSGCCYETESVSYKALDELMETLGSRLRNAPELYRPPVSLLARIFPALGGPFADPFASPIPDARELRREAASELGRLLENVRGRRCLVLFIDDVHWGDADSASLLRDLLASPYPSQLLLVLAHRSGESESSPFLRTLLPGHLPADAEFTHVRLTLDQLESSEALRLAAALAGTGSGSPLAARIVVESEGNPFLIQQLASYSRRHGLAESAPSVSLDQMVRQDLEQLPAEPRGLLELAAIAGRPIPWDVVKQAIQVPLQKSALLGFLRNRRWIRLRWLDRQCLIEIYHGRLQEMVVNELQPPQKRSLHETLANALESTGAGTPDSLALHYSEAGVESKARDYSLLAARQSAASLAFENAILFYRMALRFLPGDTAESRGVRVEYADALANAGRGPESAAAYLAARQSETGIESVELTRRAAAQLLYSGHINDGISALRHVLRNLNLPFPASGIRAVLPLLVNRGRIRWRSGNAVRHSAATSPAALDLIRVDACWSATQGFGMVDPIRAAYYQSLHYRLAIKAGEPSRIVQALAGEASYLALAGSSARARLTQVVDQARAISAGLDNPYPALLVELITGMAAFLCGDWPQASAALQLAESSFRQRCVGVAWEIATAHLMGAVALFFLGDLRALAASLPVWLARAEARGDRFEATELRIRIAHMVRLVNDQPGPARLEVAAALALVGLRRLSSSALVGLDRRNRDRPLLRRR